VFEYWTPFLVYIAIVNGTILGYLAGYLMNKVLDKREIRIILSSIGLIVGIILSLFLINNQISIEFYINRDRLELKPPYIDYLRFYLIGLSFGIIKSFYYAIVPLFVIFTAIGFLFEKIIKRREVKKNG
jgi:cytochrome c biogenesis protein CcdA